MNALRRKDPTIHFICIFLLGVMTVSFPAAAQIWNAFNVPYLYG